MSAISYSLAMSNADYYKIEKAIEFITTNYKSQPSLEEIAQSVGLSKFHFQRLFKDWAGISPKRFIQFLTLEHTKKLLATSNSIFDATFQAGLSSTSRTYELFESLDAISPKEYIQLGKNILIEYGFHQTLFGYTLIGTTNRGICALYFGQKQDHKHMLNELTNEWPQATIKPNQTKTKKLIEQIFKLKKKSKLKLFLKGTNFQIQVWKALLSTSPGEITTYKNISKLSGNPKAIRATGTAIGKNPISYLIPCHRVINKNGIIGNYRWGSNRKRAILAWESINNNKN